ncbi:MAG: phytanoyl-CoA dioxygenase family protein [Armatimonadetes bacterium]|nr:phytanoyl-CoA dioxygenase family protein [Armatimonadota bacterium]
MSGLESDGNQLTDEQALKFHEHGWVAVPEFWTKREVAAMRKELERLKGSGAMRNVATDGDGKTPSRSKENLQLCPMYDHSALFRAMPFAPKVIDAVGKLIGNPFILHLDQVFWKPARAGTGTNWHQDNAYFRISDPMKGTALWTAVHGATVENGTMRVIPNRFREEMEHVRDPDSDHHIRCYPCEDEGVPVELAAGGAIFFCYGTPHCTGPNNSDHERAGVALHFLHVNYAASDLIEPDRDYRPYMTGPKATGGLREYGVTVAGTWEAEVQRALGVS